MEARKGMKKFFESTDDSQSPSSQSPSKRVQIYAAAAVCGAHRRAGDPGTRRAWLRRALGQIAAPCRRADPPG
eukprot:1746738-Prymnesium_polylepis.1